MEQVIFLIEGSQGDHYSVVFEVNGTEAHASCTCAAGLNGQFCKHRISIMDGDVSQLLSGNTDDVGRLNILLRGTNLELAYGQVLRAEAVYGIAKKDRDVAKKALAKAMHR